jgi:beta-lactamase class A
VSASLYKLVLLAETLARVEEGSLQLDQQVMIERRFYLVANGGDSYFSSDAVGYEATIEELVYATGAYSSNVGAQALVSLTSVEQLERFASELGLSDTRYWVKAAEVSSVYAQVSGRAPSLDFTRSIAFIESFVGYGKINLTTPRDMATFFRLLRDDKLVSPVVSWQLRNVLDARVINDRFPSLLPDGIQVIHKTGNLAGVLHDVGFIETPTGPMVTVAMAQAVTDVDTTLLIEQRLGLLAYQLGSGSGDPIPAAGTPVAAVNR